MTTIGPAITGGLETVRQCQAQVQRRSITVILDEVRQLVEPAHRTIIAALPPPLVRVARYHIGWSDPDGHPTPHHGKAIRPALALLSARAAGGAADAAVPVAVAMELVHDFSLLHDDVMDGDLTRRHRPAAWTVFGTGTSILTGDALLALAWDVVASRSMPPAAAAVLARTLLELCRGQSADLAFEHHTDITLADALAMAENKTGALLGAACELGALSAGASAVTAHAYGGFGRQLGVAFQLIDDLLGIWGDPNSTGKPVYADLVRRKKSIPVVVALNSDTTAGAELAHRYADPRHIEPAELAHLAGLIEHAGGRAWAERAAGESCSAARHLLEQARLEPVASAELQSLADLVTRRDR